VLSCRILPHPAVLIAAPPHSMSASHLGLPSLGSPGGMEWSVGEEADEASRMLIRQLLSEDAAVEESAGR
jgi:hypothetical protein